MRKIIISILVFLMMFSNIGCTKKNSDVTIVTSGLSFNAEIVFDDMEFTCFAEVFDSNKTEFTFILPKEIEGLKVIFQNDNVNVEYNGLDYKINGDFLNITSLNLIYNVLKAAADSENIKNLGEGNYAIYVDKDEYNIKVGRTGLLIEIDCPSKKLYADIKNCTVK